MRTDDRLFTPLEGFDFGDDRLNDPFDYLPHSSIMEAADIITRGLDLLSQHDEALREELQRGKMLGVLVVRRDGGEVGFLRAFSGAIAGRTQMEGFVPPIYDLDVEGGYFRSEESQISQLGVEINSMLRSEGYRGAIERYEAFRAEVERSIAQARREYRESRCERTERESQHQKGELRRLETSLRCELETLRAEVERQKSGVEQLRERRSAMSNALQRRMFESYRVVNGEGEWRSLYSIFKERHDRLPPAGAGECAAPKLLHYALTHRYTPLAIGEFWRGRSPKGEVRDQGQFYGACHGKCLPILSYMLRGVDVAPVAKELARDGAVDGALNILFEDSDVVVFDKPAGMLSVRGRIDAPSVESFVNEYYAGAMMLHRLDQDTSGVLVVAKSREVHRLLQRQFSERTLSKRYIAIVEGCVAEESGDIELPMRPDPLDRPRQVVDPIGGKSAVTHFEVLSRSDDRSTTRLALYPHTGRTHQLRLHCAHREGLAAPIAGDRLYGRGVVSAPRLALHAESITFVHPRSGERVTFSCEATF